MKKKIVSLILAFTLAVPMIACQNQNSINSAEQIQDEVQDTTQVINTELEMEGASYIELSDDEIKVDGDAVTTNTKAAVYVANDIVYYEEGKDFTYGEGTEKDTHSKDEANKHTVVHITKPGTYILSGKLEAGQIAVDLGEEAEDDPEAVVTLVLDNVDITCRVAPGVIFYNVYECCTSDEDEATMTVDTSAAGANVLIADGSVNNITGSYVSKIYKSVELSEDGTEVVDSKKLHKYDGAFYSKMSMNINGGEIGDGMLNINAENEGLGTELHLTVNGGQINIVSGNDGINTNEENVSVTTVNDGYLNIRVDGSTGEGDGIDSNGWLVINGGVVNSAACATSGDAGIDSDKGIHINGGTVVATGNMLDRIAESQQNYVVFTFGDKVKGGDEILLVKGEESQFLTMPNDFTYLIISKADFGEEGNYTLWKGEEQLSVVEMNGTAQGAGMMKPDSEVPDGMEKGKRPEMPDGMKEGKRPEMPDGMEEGKRPEMTDGMKEGKGLEMPDGMKEGKSPEMTDGMKEGKSPEMSDGMEESERPQMLDGMEPGEGPEKSEKMEPGQRIENMENNKMPGDGRGGRGGFGQINLEDAVTEFEIKAGENMFMVITTGKEN